MTSLQKAQNTMLRILRNQKIKDKVRISAMLEEVNMLSVNQMAAQIKLTEMWKATHIEDYPIKVERRSEKIEEKMTRSVIRGDIIISGISSSSNKSFMVSGAKLWNKAPAAIREANTLLMAKKEIFKLCKTWPI